METLPSQTESAQIGVSSGESAQIRVNELPKQASDLNRAALKRQALKVSKLARSGKFTRISEEFCLNIGVALDAKLREFRREVAGALTQVDPEEGEDFLTATGKRKVLEAFNIWLAREIHRQAHKVRVGKTL